MTVSIANDRDAILQGGLARDTDPRNGKYVLLSTTTPLFRVSTDGVTPTPSSITLTASVNGIPGGVVSWSTTAGTLTGSGDNVRTLTFANMPVDQITVTATITDLGETYTAFVGISKLYDGVGGATGATGSRGAGHFYASGSAWSDIVADAATPGGNIVDDVVTISNGTTFVDERRWTGSAWIANGVVVDGNLIVNGSVVAAKINSNGLSIRDNLGNIILAAGSTLAPTYAAVGTVNADLLPSITAAQTAADNAQGSANTANTELANISSDNVLSKVEKSDVILKFSAITGELADIQAKALAQSVSSATYTAAYNTLNTYLGGLSPAWNDTTTNTTIVGTTFRTRFTDYYNARQLLLNALAADAATRGNNAQTSANTANTAIANIASDNILSPLEKQALRKEWNIVASEKAGINTTAATYSAVSTLNGTYNTAFQALATYLNAGTAYTITVPPSATPPSWLADASLSTDTVIVGATFRANWKAMYDARVALVNAITVESGKWSNMSGQTNAPANNATVGATKDNLFVTLPGDNMCANSSFERVSSTAGLAEGFNIYNNAGGSEPTTASFIAGRVGGQAQLISWTVSNYSTKGVWGSIAARGWEPLKTYVVSFYAASSTAIGIPTLNWNVAPASTEALVAPNLTGNWQRYVFRITMGASVETLGRCYISAPSAAAGGSIAFDDLMVTEGDVLAAWYPSTLDAQAVADAANVSLGLIASDNWLSKGEKPELILNWGAITGEINDILTRADNQGVSRTTLLAVYNALDAYLSAMSPGYADTSQDTPIVGTTFRQKFTDYYNARTAVLTAISANAATRGDNAQAAANTANATLAVIASDNWLSKGEKPEVILKFTAIVNEIGGLQARAIAQGVSSAAYTAAYNALNTYLGAMSPAWNDVATDTAIVGATFRANFASYYTEKTALVNALTGDAATRGDNAQLAANTANAAIANISSDNVLSKGEKSDVVREWQAIDAAHAGILTSASALAVSSSSLVSTRSALDTYLVSLSPYWSDFSTDTPIVGATFRTKFSDYYAARQDVLNAIAAAAAAAGAKAGTNLKDAAGNILGDGAIKNAYTEGTIGHTIRPAGGYFAAGENATGTLVVILPTARYKSNTMLRIRVEIYEYGPGRSCTYVLSGYNSTSGWINVTATYDGPTTSRRQVRFTDTGVGEAIYIGETTSVWQYPQVRITEVTTGFQNYDASLWNSGWGVGLTGSFSSVQHLITAPGIGGAFARIDTVSPSNVATYIEPNAIGNTQIGGNLLSTNWNGSTGTAGAGWLLERSGNFYGNNVVLRGAIMGGNFTSYNWPASGGGMYIGPEGALFGNNNTGPYLQISSNGDIYAPGFNIISGSASFSGALSAAFGTFGALTVAAGGHIKSGQTAYNTGTGFWLGLDGGVPKFSIGTAGGNRMTWDGSTLNYIGNVELPPFSATISGTLDTSKSNTTSAVSIGTLTAVPSGGRGTLKYNWTCELVETNPATSTGLITVAASTSSVTGASAKVSTFNTSVIARITLTVTDADNRVAIAVRTASVQFGTPP